MRGGPAFSGSRGCAGAGTTWRLNCVNEGMTGGVSMPTVILPLLRNLAQLRQAVELGVEVQYILAVEALAGLDELEVCLLELPEFHDMVL
jgi:hypothetical protein